MGDARQKMINVLRVKEDHKKGELCVKRWYDVKMNEWNEKEEWAGY